MYMACRHSKTCLRTCKCGGKLHRCALKPSANGGLRCFHCDQCGAVFAVDEDGKRTGGYGRVNAAGDAVVGHAEKKP